MGQQACHEPFWHSGEWLSSSSACSCPTPSASTFWEQHLSGKVACAGATAGQGAAAADAGTATILVMNDLTPEQSWKGTAVSLWHDISTAMPLSSTGSVGSVSSKGFKCKYRHQTLS